MRAVLSMPRGDGPFPIVVTIHGGQGNRDLAFIRTLAVPGGISQTVTMLNEQPWAVLAISYRASGGAVLGMEQDDVVAGIRFAMTLRRIDPAQIVVPALFLTSLADEQVPHVMVEPTIARLKTAGRDVTLYTAIKSLHGFYWGRDVGGSRVGRGAKSRDELAEEAAARSQILRFFTRCFGTASPVTRLRAGEHTRTISVGTLQRRYRVHVPKKAARLVAHRIAAVADTSAAAVAEVSLVRSSVRTRQADLNGPSCGGHSRHYTDWCKLGS